MGKEPSSETAKGLDRVIGADRSAAQDSRENVNLLEELAHFCQNAGEFPTALEYYSQILDLAQRATESGDLISATARRMALCLEGTGELDRALDMFNLAISRIDRDESAEEMANTLLDRSHVLSRKGDYEAADRDAREALAILQKRPMSAKLGKVFRALGHIALRTGRMEDARDAYESSLAIYRAMGDRAGMAKCYNNLGLVCKNRGHLDEASQFQQQALAIARELGNKLRIGIRLNNLGIVEQKRGNWEAARQAGEEALRIFRELGNKWEVSFGYLNLAHYHRYRRDWDRAEELYTLSLQTSRENGDRRGEILYYEHFGEFCLKRGEFRRAEEMLTRGYKMAQEVSPDSELAAEILRRRGESRLEGGELEGAEEDLREALQISRQVGDRFEEGTSLRALGLLQAAQNETERAEVKIRTSIEVFTEIGAQFEKALSITALGEITRTDESLRQEVARMLATAAESLHAMGAAYEEAKAQLARAEILVDSGDGPDAIELLADIQLILEKEGTEADHARAREVRIRSDRSVVTHSVTGTNTLSSFNALMKTIHVIADAEERLQQTLKLLMDRTAAERLVLLSGDGSGAKLQVRESCGIAPTEWHSTVEVARMVMGRAAGKGDQPIYSTNPLRDSRIETTGPQLPRIGSLLAIPIRGELECAGGIYLDRSVGTPPFGREELDFAIALTGVAAGILLDLQAEKIRNENLRLRHRLGMGEGFERVVTQSPRMLKIIDTLQKLQTSAATVLLQGETGTGKELFARAIHQSSTRNDKPFITVNCAELSQDVLESELFGHKRGAFTDAKNSKTGLFERAEGGTVFIDEVDKASRYFQDTLLRVVDRREVKPVGETDPIPVNVRIICAANKDLREEAEQDRFLKDLYFRLRVVSIHLPALRERKEDIVLLADHFLSKHSTSQGKTFDGFDMNAIKLLVEYHWPGNVRDLAHEIERIVAVTPEGGMIGPELLSPDITEGASMDSSGTLGEVVERIEQQMIRDALRKCDGNKSQAARVLGLSRRGFLNKLQRYHIH